MSIEDEARAEDTLDKVYDALRTGLPAWKASEAITAMQNAGILFRERAPEPSEVWPPDGWFPFGSHVDWSGPLEFSKETTEDGMPAWERHVAAEPSDTDEREALVQLLLDRKFNDPLIEYASTEPDDVALVGEIVDLILGALHRQGQITEAMVEAAATVIAESEDTGSLANARAALEAAEEARCDHHS